MVGEVLKVPVVPAVVLSILYSTVNPAMAGTAGNVKGALQVLVGDVMIGAVGKITTLTVLLSAHAPKPGVLAAVAPHTALSTYLALTL